MQWTCSIVLAITIPLGALMALSGICHDNSKRRHHFFSFIAFHVPLLINLAGVGISYPIITTTALKLTDLGRNDSRIRSLFECTLKAENFEESKRAAQYLYRSYGIKTTFVDDKDGALKRYHPTELDEEQWEKRQIHNKEILSMQKDINHHLEQFPWLFALNVGTYTIIMTIGLALFSFRKSANKPME